MLITKTRFGRSAPDDVGVMTGMHLIAAEGQPLHVAVSRRSSEVGSEALKSVHSAVVRIRR